MSPEEVLSTLESIARRADETGELRSRNDVLELACRLREEVAAASLRRDPDYSDWVDPHVFS